MSVTENWAKDGHEAGNVAGQNAGDRAIVGIKIPYPKIISSNAPCPVPVLCKCVVLGLKFPLFNICLKKMIKNN